MKKTIPVRSKYIIVQLVPHVVRVTTDDELEDLLSNDVKKSTAELVTAIKSQYQKEFGSVFTVSNRSMSVEIWGHAYADQLAKWIKKRFRFKLVAQITDKISERAGSIDIGEKGHDSNRFVWDFLASFLSVISFFLP